MTDEVVADRYCLERRLGAGGMAEVWEARDLELGRAVALKLLGPEADPARFEREAHAAAALSHPNVTQLFDYGAWRGRPYMVLELVPGGTLEDRLSEGRPLPDAETERITGEIAAGLAHAHARGLVHRDLKPANVLFDADGRAKIADFGIARMGGDGTLTEAGTLLGTAAYISPEQAAGESATVASDVYAFGVILFRMLTGRLPFEADEPVELVRMHRDLPPPPVAGLRRDAPPQLARIADAALAKDPHARPADGSALAAALGGVPPTTEEATAVLTRPPAATTAATRAAPVPAAPPARPVRIRRGRLVALFLGLLVAAAAGLAVAFLGHGSSSPVTTASTRHRPTTHSTTTRSTSTQPSTNTSSTSSTSTTSTTTHPKTTTHRTTTRPTTRQTTTTTPPTSSTQPTLSSTTVSVSSTTVTAPVP